MYKVKNIYWERAILHIVLNHNTKKDVFLVYKENNLKCPVSKFKEIIINVTNFPEGEMLSKGTWHIEIDGERLVLDDKLISKLNDYSRSFMYGKNLYAYLINFSLDKEMHFKIKTTFMMINNHPERFHRLQTADSLRKYISTFFKISAVYLANIYYKFMRIFKTGKNNVLFLSENNAELTGNLKFLYNYMKGNPNYQIKIYTHNHFVGKKSIHMYLKELTALAKCDVLIVDNYVPTLTHLKLAKKVKVIQLWHAGIGFKALGYARFGFSGPNPYKSCHRNYTYIVVDQEKLIPIYKEVFGTSEEKFRSFGIPRLDNYLSKEKIKNSLNNLYRINPLFKTCKVILFSPTFRGSGNKDAHYDYSLIDLDKIYDFCIKNNAIFVIKMHPFIRKKINIPEEYQNKIFDYSDLDINDLIYVSDVMITDYSSCVYEYSLFNRPIIFFRFDKNIYEYQRFVYTIEEFTNGEYEVTSFDEVLKILEKLSPFIKTENRFANMQKRVNNNSCERIVTELIGDLK